MIKLENFEIDFPHGLRFASEEHEIIFQSFSLMPLNQTIQTNFNSSFLSAKALTFYKIVSLKK